MKIKLKNYLFFGISALLLTACITDEKYYVTEEHTHHYDGTWVFVKEYEIGSGEYRWTFDPDESLFYCDVYIKDLTQEIYDEGMIACYYIYDVDGRQVDSPLPFTEFRMNGGYQYSYQYTCEISPYRVTFILKDSDYSMDSHSADPRTFVVKMIR